jgi:hypothetical protein
MVCPKLKVKPRCRYDPSDKEYSDLIPKVHPI